MQALERDITTDPGWLAQQTDRLISFELLRRALRADYSPIEPAELGDRVALDKQAPYRIIEGLKKRLNAR